MKILLVKCRWKDMMLGCRFWTQRQMLYCDGINNPYLEYDLQKMMVKTVIRLLDFQLGPTKMMVTTAEVSAGPN
jgi:hypothetical protein